MNALSKLLVASAFVAGGTGALPAQGADVPCKASTCVMVLDWGPGKTSANYPPDRRYGSGDDFEARFKSAMGAHGFRLRDTPAEGAVIMTLRTTMRPKVMCDAMAGLNTDMTCTAMSGLAVSFAGGDPAVKPPGAIRITNRCAAGDVFMLNKEFAQYAADMIWWQLEGQAAKAERPVVHC